MVVGALLCAVGLGWLTLTDVHSSYLGSILGPTLIFGSGMGLQFVSLTLMAVSGVEPQDAGAASGILNATQQVGGSLGLSVLVTVFGTASRNEATDQVPRFLAQATPAQRFEFRRTGTLPAPWGDQVLTSGISGAFIAAAVFAVVAALIALLVIQVRPGDLERLQGGGLPLVPAAESAESVDGSPAAAAAPGKSEAAPGGGRPGAA
jgi:hypothetical protein